MTSNSAPAASDITAILHGMLSSAFGAPVISKVTVNRVESDGIVFELKVDRKGRNPKHIYIFI